MEQNLKKYIGNKIRTVRRKNHYTQEQLADALDIGVSHLSNIERGITIENLLKICEIFGVSTDYFLMGIAHSNSVSQNLVERIKCLDEKKIRLVDAFVMMLEDFEL